MSLAITEIEEVEQEEYPYPARVIPIQEALERSQEIWERARPAMDDWSDDPRGFFGSIYMKETVLLEFGDWDGLVWVYHLNPGNTATISFVFWGDWRKFIAKYGPGREAMNDVIEWIMDSFDLVKVRAFCGEWNKPSWKMIERVGFVKEGVLRKEAKVDGVRYDTYAYGLLREEVFDGQDD